MTFWQWLDGLDWVSIRTVGLVVLGSVLTLLTTLTVEAVKSRGQGREKREAAYEAVRDALAKDVLSIDGVVVNGIVQKIEASYARSDALARLRLSGGADADPFVQSIEDAWTGGKNSPSESILQKIHRHAAVSEALSRTMATWVEKPSKVESVKQEFETVFRNEMARYEARREADRVAGKQSILDKYSSIEEARAAQDGKNAEEPSGVV